MSRIQSITLPNLASIVPTYLVVHHRPGDAREWDVTSIEIFSDTDCTSLIAELQINDLPRDTQESIYSALSIRAEKAQRARGLRRLLNDLRDLRAEQRG